MKRKVKIIISVISFICLFACAFYVVDRTLRFKYADGILPMEDLYEYPNNSIDVLLLGSSHVGVNIDTVRLCNEFGIAAYNLWGAVQPSWNSYFYLVEALKTQTPRVVVMETFLVSQDYEYMDYSRIIKNTIGMKMSKNKVDAVLASATEDVLADVLLGFSTYHSRYGALEEIDFERYAWNREISDKNINNGDYVTSCQVPERVGSGETEALSDKMEEYFIKIIELCRKKDIPLVLYTSPYSASEKEMRRYNRIGEIAESYGIPYVNYNLVYEEAGIDFSRDFADSAGHFNNGGVEKMTAALGAYLKDNYELPERYDDRWFNMWPDTDAVYVLREPFTGDGEKAYMDTGVPLYYDESASFTVMMQFGTRVEGDNRVFISCFSEEQPYRGLLVREDNGILKIIYGDNYYTEAEMPRGDTATLVITKNINVYNVYLNGECIAENIQTVCGEYSGNLLIGCQASADFDKIRFSAVTVDQLEVYDKVLAEKEIYEWMSANASRLTRDQIEEQLHENYTGSLNYVMEEEFAGDGVSKYLDTGVQLYYEEDRDYTLLIDYNTKIESADGVIAGCFSEEEGAYRGILIRRDAQVLHIIVGANYYVEVMMEEDASAKLAITKSKDTYTVYVNGIPVASDIVSPCEAHIGTLLVGAQENPDYEKFRFTAVTVNRLEVRDEVMDIMDIQRW